MKYDEMVRRVNAIRSLNERVLEAERVLNAHNKIGTLSIGRMVGQHTMTLDFNDGGHRKDLWDRLQHTVSEAIVSQLAEWKQAIEELEKDA